MRSALDPSRFWKAELALPVSHKPCNLIHQVGLLVTQIHERSFVKANEVVKKGEVVGMEEARSDAAYLAVDSEIKHNSRVHIC